MLSMTTFYVTLYFAFGASFIEFLCYMVKQIHGKEAGFLGRIILFLLWPALFLVFLFELMSK